MPPPKLHPMPMIGNQPAWREVLRQAGLPFHVVMLDFETYFDADYSMGRSDKSLSTFEYVNDPRFEETAKAFILMKQPFEPVTPSIWRGDDDTYIRYLQREYGKNLEGCTVTAQNLVFDGYILYQKYGIKPPCTLDLLGLARHEESRDRNDLDSLCTRHGLPPKGDTNRFKGIHLNAKYERIAGRPPKLTHRGITPEEWCSLSEYVGGDVWRQWHLFTYLLPRLSNPATEVKLMQHTLELAWKPTLAVDRQFAAELTVKMEGRIDEVVNKTGASREEISGNKTFGFLLDAALKEAGDKVEKYQKTNKRGEPMLAIAKADEQLELLQTHQNQRVRELIAARSAIKSWPLHIGRVRRIVRIADAAGGLLPVPLKYCGAHTGRWSGGERINLQNLSSRNIEELINSIRGIIVAPDGYSLVIVDLSAIEARVLSWIAGQEDLNDLFRSGAEVYCEYAGKMAGRTLRKARKSDPPSLAKYYTRMRNMGKVQVLGCGYGMGADKCVAFAGTSYGVDITLFEATRLVNSYRASVPCITRFWRTIEQKFKAAARYGERSSMDRGLAFHKEGDITIITLPNGRTLKYPGVRVSIVNGREQLWMPDPMKPGNRIKMWGGYLTENVVQAMSRDLLGEAMLRLEARGKHTALHCHDELVLVESKDTANECLEMTIEEFTREPVWAPGLPLAAEGSVATRYGK